ncbi:hypothetical protein Cs7R123_40240 [Catellatospora sp. TT07R-123]|uniref:hypothetical protein n=1 Tax=Catellatospora sp. TT07R-123 TaxID=2733863 RepID=UPI001B000FEB|nr:hypothetical protein [Catellatospora sp. TT07R-123]GHJ46682.1 hypothetical protein Cs7R123_40240 [Catellatospora sp. TT07R-123]
MSTVDLDLLADWMDGALDGTPDEARVGDLVAHDPAWAEAAGLMRSAMPLVSADLALLAATPEPMPADLAARFDELLAGPQFAPAPTPAPRSGTGERTLDRRPATAARRRRRWAVPVGVAAAALALAGITLPLSQLGGAGSAADSGAEMPASAELSSALYRRLSSGTDYNRYTVTDDLRNGMQTPPMTTLSTPETKSTPGDASSWMSQNTPPELRQLAESQPALGGCLSAVSATLPGTVELVDFARFEGRPALVITMATTTGRWVVVAGPQCGVNGSDELFRVAAD